MSNDWYVSGTYFEACNCEPICPCRTVGNRPGGRSTFGECFGTLSWYIVDGRFADLDLCGRSVALSLRYFDDELGSPWQVMLYIDEDGSPRQQEALADIFLGRAGGTALGNYAAAIGAVVAIRTAQIALDHRPHHQEIVITHVVTVRAAEDVVSDALVSCGIPGRNRPGQEVRAEVMRSEDPPFVWDVRSRCGFATDFRYTSDG